MGSGGVTGSAEKCHFRRSQRLQLSGCVMENRHFSDSSLTPCAHQPPPRTFGKQRTPPRVPLISIDVDETAAHLSRGQDAGADPAVQGRAILDATARSTTRRTAGNRTNRPRRPARSDLPAHPARTRRSLINPDPAAVHCRGLGRGRPGAARGAPSWSMKPTGVPRDCLTGCAW